MDAIETNLMQYFVTGDGANLFLGFEEKLRSLINKKLGKKETWYHPAGAIRFLVTGHLLRPPTKC